MMYMENEGASGDVDENKGPDFLELSGSGDVEGKICHGCSG